jgi:phosphate transport system permease protein
MGETMAVAMLIGNSSRLSWSIFRPPAPSQACLPTSSARPKGSKVNSLMYAALISIALTLLVNLLGEAVLRRTQKQTAGIR